MAEKANILVVDDNISLCRSLSLVLEYEGYAVTTANDGPEAIGKVREEPFDMIFMDVKMPGMNGTETFREVNKIRPETLVVMMTAYAVEDLVQEALEEGAYGILYKPLDMEDVLKSLEETLKREQK